MSTGNHDHAHGHDHHHDGDTFYLDQICMVGISGFFGAICLALYITNALAAEGSQPMLALVLGRQFHLFVLLSGIALVVIAAVRAVALWGQAGKPAHVHHHDHDHDRDHEHQHDHDREHHHHDHDHHHHAHHDHAAEDHDHGWAPWRYVLLLVPIVLFLLGLPNKGPQAGAATVHVDLTQEAAGYGGMIASAPVTEGQVLTYLAALYLAEGDVIDVPFKDLYEKFSNDEELRASMKGKTVRVRGLFSPSLGSDRVFNLTRFRINCCGADAIRLNVPMVTRESLMNRPDLKANAWVKVIGVVDFQQRGGRYFTLLRVLNLNSIQPCPPDPNPYVQ